MSLPRAAVFTVKVAALLSAAAIAVSTPLFAATAASADPTSPSTQTTDGHGWGD
jgi:hypothetical protein